MKQIVERARRRLLALVVFLLGAGPLSIDRLIAGKQTHKEHTR